jgi:hypothetical protein
MAETSVNGRDTAEFRRIAAGLHIEKESDEFAVAATFWRGLLSEMGARGEDGTGWKARTMIEEAVVWRVTAARMVEELGRAGLFQQRTKGPAEGISAVHPAVDALAKTYERLRRSLRDLLEPAGENRPGKPQGLPDLMRPILEEAEVVFDELLGPGGFPGRAPKNGLDRGSDSPE